MGVWVQCAGVALWLRWLYSFADSFNVDAIPCQSRLTALYQPATNTGCLPIISDCMWNADVRCLVLPPHFLMTHCLTVILLAVSSVAMQQSAYFQSCLCICCHHRSRHDLRSLRLCVVSKLLHYPMLGHLLDSFEGQALCQFLILCSWNQLQ